MLLIKELFPFRFLNTIPNILLMEIDKAINNSNFSPFCEGTEKVSFENEINKLAQGIYDDKAKSFINDKWEGKRADIQKKVSELNGNRDMFVFADDFQTFVDRNKKIQQFMAEGLIFERVLDIPNRYRKKMAKKILRNPDKFPLIVTLIKANLFLNFRALKFRACSHDTLDDLKHLINASYTDVFVTGDGKLYNYSKEIHTDLEILSQDDFLSG